MKVKELSKQFFETQEIRQEAVLDAIDFFLEKLKKIGGTIDSIYPADPFALPLAMYISDKLSIPIKTEQFLKEDEKILTLFSTLYKNYVTPTYISQKLKIFRKRFPHSPSVLIAGNNQEIFTDVQLIKFNNEVEIFSYRFRREALKNFFFPVEGEITHFSQDFWQLAKEEIKTFEKARRIRDNARRFLREETAPLKILESDPEIVLWEKFVKLSLSPPRQINRETETNIKLKTEKLIQVEDKKTNSAITSLLEYFSQIFEAHFPTYLAYSSLEITDRRGITIIPQVSQIMEGADVKLEIVLRSENVETDYKRLIAVLKEAFRIIFTEIFEKEAFRPAIDSVVEKETNKASVYVNWFLDKEMIEKLTKKINKRWLLSRLLYRKRFKSQMREFLKSLEEFTFTPENLDYLIATIEGLWKQNPTYVRLYGKEIKKLLDGKDLWGIVGYYGTKIYGSKSKLLTSLLNFLLSLKGYENIHHFLAEEKTYFIPVQTKRILRPNWERVIKEEQDVYLKPEPLNPESPVTYTLMSEDGKLLGTIPKIFAHYIAARESIGKTITCEKLYFDPDIFSENSYWIKVSCL
ncbi:hypothetical protein SAMN06265339_0657 [Desulfurobacterium pacificum]|uniref:Uncharacterized protein n=1 Tax=Desulfurobacterium pacificum TaxID=240166 RepID=A0ABY1NGB4_9BACT|nr:hypothetical protein [Desulfurobacterium pacificum]SMP08845.1 hypothetical protein SAMN06265339_0657 [Desulfurobacterium pacificum]